MVDSKSGVLGLDNILMRYIGYMEWGYGRMSKEMFSTYTRL